MYTTMDAHPVTLIVVMAALMVTPFHALLTYTMSGASPRKGALIGAAFLVWGACMSWVCLSDAVRSLGPLGQLVIPVCWITPSAVLVIFRRWFLDQPLSQRWLVGLQVWRAIGAVFLLEMSRGNLPGIFAYPAGLGDIAVALIALFALLAGSGTGTVPRPLVVLVLVAGVIDFLFAFFFGFTSSEGPQQLFHPRTPNSVLLFPTGMIPFFLVPYAIFFHTLSLLSLRRAGKSL